MVCYQLSNLLLYKHELLLSKCPLTADWLLIRPVWNEISKEPLNYDPNPITHNLSHICPPPVSPLLFRVVSLFTLLPRLPTSSPVTAPLSLSGLSTLDLSLLRFLFSHLQSVTVVGDQTSACLTRSSTGALAVGGAVWAAETTLMGPIVSAAERITTGDLLKSPAYPATVISMVNP